MCSALQYRDKQVYGFRNFWQAWYISRDEAHFFCGRVHMSSRRFSSCASGAECTSILFEVAAIST